MMTATQPKREMIYSLTGLRFIAAFLVFVSHFYIFNYFIGLTHGPGFDLLDQSGWLGVSFFFVLSGFVLFINYGTPQRKRTSAKDFYINRFARIYPVFFLTTWMALPIELLSPERRAVWLHLFANLFLVHCFHPETCGTMNQPGWSIGVESVFYLLFPALMLLFVSRRVKRNVALAFLGYFLYLGLMLLLLFGNYYARATFPFNRVGEFLLGMGAGYFYLNYEHHPWVRAAASVRNIQVWAMGLAGGLFALMVLQPFLLEWFPVLQQVFYLLYALPALGIVSIFAFLEREGRMPSIFLHPLLILGGEISYSFYLIHQLVIRYAKHLLHLILHLPVEATYSPLGALMGLSILGVCLLSAYGMYHYFEKPMRKKIIARFTTPVAPTPRREVNSRKAVGIVH